VDVCDHLRKSDADAERNHGDQSPSRPIPALKDEPANDCHKQEHHRDLDIENKIERTSAKNPTRESFSKDDRQKNHCQDHYSRTRGLSGRVHKREVAPAQALRTVVANRAAELKPLAGTRCSAFDNLMVVVVVAID
jgi:hypothetical protein